MELREVLILELSKVQEIEWKTQHYTYINFFCKNLKTILEYSRILSFVTKCSLTFCPQIINLLSEQLLQMSLREACNVRIAVSPLYACQAKELK